MRVPFLHSVVIWSDSIRRAFFLWSRAHKDFRVGYAFPCTNACFAYMTHRILDQQQASSPIPPVGGVKV